MIDFLPELQTEYEQIAKCRIGRLEPGLDADGVVSACKKIVDDVRLHRIRIENLINTYLNPMLENIIHCSDEEEALLFDTVQKISAYEVRLDPGLAYKIYQSLLDKAREKKDPDKTLKYLYWCGITLFYFINKQSDKILEYFEEGSSHSSRYRRIKDEDTRRYVHRCLGNYHMMLFTANQPEKAMETEEVIFNFWNQLILLDIDHDFPWISYFLTCLTHKIAYLLKTAHTDPDSETKENYNKILDAAISANKLYHRNKDLFKIHGGTRYDFMLWEVQFLTGLISFNQILENVYNKQDTYDIDDYSSDAIYAKINMLAFLMFYAANMRELKSVKSDILPEISKRIIQFVSMIPKNVNTGEINRQLRSLTGDLSELLEPKELLGFVLEMTVYRNIPTYAHSLTVGKIAACLAKFLAERNAGYFDDYIDLPEVNVYIKSIEELYGFIESCGLCHDIGKFIYSDNPFMLVRILTEEELKVVKMHPEEGYSIFSRKDNVLYDGYKDVILGHHKFYDNSDGYPDNFDINKSKHKIIIDIIKAADSIDAATDDIGKAYSSAKSFEEVCEEIQIGAGHEYSPLIADLLKDDSVISELKHILDVERKNAYNTAYLHAWS